MTSRVTVDDVIQQYELKVVKSKDLVLRIAQRVRKSKQFNTFLKYQNQLSEDTTIDDEYVRLYNVARDYANEVAGRGFKSLLERVKKDKRLGAFAEDAYDDVQDMARQLVWYQAQGL